MPAPNNHHSTASCRCGKVELRITGAPITSLVCYCDDCRRGSREIEALANAGPVQDADGGTAYVLYRKDRVECSRGAQFLQNLKIEDASATSRVVATCCNSAMSMKFDDARHWSPVYRARLDGSAPPLQMRICTRFKPEGSRIARDVPSHAGYPLVFLMKLIGAWIPMLLRR
jgi:hypothetical protein